ncbi:MAG: hypothetical protein K2G69_02660 [Muribaculaceae bacterium]|nr:hypothetical protein [Muribaculaceae bacterium]
MGNFFGSLAKGMVRSAANQVGRDGGRVVSNQIYGNRNYTPVGVVNPQQPPIPPQPSQPLDSDNSQIHMNNQFFNIDIDALMRADDFIPASFDKGLVGVKEVDLTEKPVMDMFNKVTLLKYSDGSFNIDFTSTKYAPNQTLMEFMKYCTEKWGKDRNGRGLPSQSDVQALKDGRFGRNWDYVKLLQIKNDDSIALSVVMRLHIPNKDTMEFANSVNTMSQATPQPAPSQTPPNPNQIPSNAQIQPISFPSGLYIILFIFGIGSIGGLIMLIYGYMRYDKRLVKVKWQERVTGRIPDRRYSKGYRTASSVVTKTRMVKADDTIRNEYKRQGKIFMITGAALIVVTIIMYAIFS